MGVTGGLRTTKDTIFVFLSLNVVLLKVKKYATLSIFNETGVRMVGWM